MIQQLLRLPRVFAGNAVHAPQHIERAQGDVAQVADGRGDEIKAGRERSALRKNWIPSSLEA